MKLSLSWALMFLLVSETISQDFLEPRVNILTELMSMKEKIKVMEEEIKDLRTVNRDQTDQIEVLKASVNVTHDRIEKLQNRDQPRVAFWATLSTPLGPYRNIGPFNEPHTLVYRSALTNIGNGYNTKTGIFTAPVKGVYYFNVVLFNANPPDTGVHIMKNRVRLVSITDNPPGQDFEDTASNSVTLLLEKGDQIHIELIEKRKVYTDLAGRNSFSGHLLFPTE